jgi:hypothetical protein
VLGLPLAFILSQDQTLHRIFLIFSIQVASLSIIIEKSYSLLFSNLHRCKFVLSIQYVYERVILFYPRLSLKAGAKVQFFFNLTSFFEKIFNSFSNKPKH